MNKINEETLNITTRKFLKNVGVNSQRIIETAIRDSVNSGEIASSKTVKVSVNLKIDELNIEEKITGNIEVEI